MLRMSPRIPPYGRETMSGPDDCHSREPEQLIRFPERFNRRRGEPADAPRSRRRRVRTVFTTPTFSQTRTGGQILPSLISYNPLLRWHGDSLRLGALAPPFPGSGGPARAPPALTGATLIARGSHHPENVARGRGGGCQRRGEPSEKAPRRLPGTR